jgi:hypothetical protein
MVSVCKTEDDFLEDKSLWFVDLTNGERIWMDDGRPGIHPRSAWLRLATYLKETNTSIVRMCIKFRSHLESPLPENAPGYFFSHKVLAFWGEDVTIPSFLIGFFDGETIHVQEWQVPELMQINLESRKPHELREPACLILNNGESARSMANT